MSVFPSQTSFVTGDILTATAMNEIGQAINLLDGAQTSAGKNTVINGAMDFFQRSATPTTGLAITGGGYLLDRWAGYRAVAGATGSRQITNDTTNLPFIQYCARVARDSGNTSTSNISIGQSIETSNSTPLVGKIVTVSFYARAGANYSSAASALGIRVLSSTSVDASVILAGGTSVITSTATLTSTWQRFTFTSAAVVGLTAKTIGVLFDYTPVGTAGANDYFEVTGVQLEAANTASNFQRAAGNIQGELAACQRYLPAFITSASGTLVGGYGYATNSAIYMLPLPVNARVAPTGITLIGNFEAFGLNTAYAATPAFNGGTITTGTVTVTSGLTIVAGQGSRLSTNGAATILFTGCEL